MPEYKPEDIRRFRETDCRIVLQNCLRHATQIVLACDSRNKDQDVNCIECMAADLARWVYGEAVKMADEQLAEPPKPIPMPTPQQSAVLAACLAAYNTDKPEGTVVSFEKLAAAVWAKYGKFPVNTASESIILKEIPVTAIVEQVQK